MKIIKNNAILAVVFVTGACVLIIEVVAVRLLAPYFGNTIFTVSSVLSVILSALSLGYYVGGRLADKSQSNKWFFFIIGVSGVFVLLMQFFAFSVLPFFGALFSLVYGPLVSSLVLFFIPSFLLGTLSPYAITIQHNHNPKIGIGTTSGKIFFFSTMGSIFGSMSAGFFLIPRFGVDSILIGVGLFLVVIGFVPYITKSVRYLALFMICLFTVLFMNYVVVIAIREQSKELVYKSQGVYENTVIYDGKFEGRDARFLQQDRSASASMFLDSEDLVYDYTKYYALHSLFTPKVKNALVIGGGAYSVPKAILKEIPNADVYVAEIEPSLSNLGKKYFRVPNNTRLKTYTYDGRRFLQKSNEFYDLIFGDAYSSIFSIPAHLTTREFFQLALNRLSEEGVIIINIAGTLSRENPSFILSEMRTFQSVFPQSYFFAVEGAHYSGPQNIIFVGHNSDRRISFTDPDLFINENPIIKSLNLQDSYINMDRFELSDYSEFTDKYSPVSYFISKVIGVVGRSENNLGEEMMSLIRQQERYGPRFVGSYGHRRVRDFIIAESQALADKVILQEWSEKIEGNQTEQLTNIIGQFYPEKPRRIILGTHYDSRKFAEKDKNNPLSFVTGANDSASGVAVLLQLAELLANNEKEPSFGVDIVFFDGEELGNVPISRGWQPLGSTHFAKNLYEIYKNIPEQAIIIDMVCEKDLTILKEPGSLRYANKYVDEFWDIANSAYPDIFSNETYKYEILDDHTPLNLAGIPSMLLIDFDYPYFHTTEDTSDKCSKDSMEAVLESIYTFIN